MVSRIFLAMAVRAEIYARGLSAVAHAQDKLNALELFSLKKKDENIKMCLLL